MRKDKEREGKGGKGRTKKIRKGSEDEGEGTKKREGGEREGGKRIKWKEGTKKIKCNNLLKISL